jgi:hypothetical protein
MSSAELTSIQSPREVTADLTALRLRSRPIVTGGQNLEAFVRPGPGTCGGTAEPQAELSRSPAAFNAIAAWLRRALAESARAWAIAAGVPPHLYD